MEMKVSQIGVTALIIGLTLLSGIADAQGFIHASTTWMNGKIIWEEGLKSLLGFGVGALCYILAINYLEQVGLVSAEIQTVIWFTVTIIGVAFISGKFLHWHLVDQLVALLAIVCIGWLVIRTGG
jgi:divalent metal cation (Fe/Co/Zn/Cd) transporter